MQHPKISFHGSCFPRTNSTDLHPNRWTAKSEPKIIALDGIDDKELKGGDGLKMPVLASTEKRVLHEKSSEFDTMSLDVADSYLPWMEPGDPGAWNGVTWRWRFPQRIISTSEIPAFLVVFVTYHAEGSTINPASEKVIHSFGYDCARRRVWYIFVNHNGARKFC